jgi:hypothetical protein
MIAAIEPNRQKRYQVDLSLAGLAWVILPVFSRSVCWSGLGASIEHGFDAGLELW